MSLVDRAKNIIVSPKNEWAVIAEESPDVGSIITTYVLPLAVLSAAASFIGYAFIGVPVPFLGTIKGVSWGLYYGIQNLIMTILGVLITAFVVDLLANSFGSEKNFGRAVQLVAYAYTPSWIGGLFSIYPPLGIIGSLFSIYGLYLLYLGLPFTMKTPKEKVIIYLIVTAIVLIVLMVVLGMILAAIMGGILGLSLLSGFSS